MRKVVLFALFVTLGFAGIGGGDAVAAATRVPWSELPRTQQDIEVFMDVGATATEIDAVDRLIRSTPTVRRFAFLDHADAYREFKRIFRNKPKLVRSTLPRDLPQSFRLDMRSKRAADSFAEEVRQTPGVDSAEPTYPKSGRQMLVAVRMCQQRGATFQLFMDVSAGPEQLEAARALVAAEPGLTVVRVLSHDDAYTEFTQAFASEPDIVRGTEPEDLPTSVRFEATSSPSDDFIGRVEAAPGVDSLVSPPDMCKDVLRLLAKGSTEEQVSKVLTQRQYRTA